MSNKSESVLVHIFWCLHAKWNALFPSLIYFFIFFIFYIYLFFLKFEKKRKKETSMRQIDICFMIEKNFNYFDIQIIITFHFKIFFILIFKNQKYKNFKKKKTKHDEKHFLHYYSLQNCSLHYLKIILSLLSPPHYFLLLNEKVCFFFFFFHFFIVLKK